jgi:hypothetical protein
VLKACSLLSSSSLLRASSVFSRLKNFGNDAGMVCFLIFSRENGGLYGKDL